MIFWAQNVLTPPKLYTIQQNIFFVFFCKTFVNEIPASRDSNVHFAKSINTKMHTKNVLFIKTPLNFRRTSEKIKKLDILPNKGVIDEDVTKDIPG